MTTPETAPKYKAIREREQSVRTNITQAAYENIGAPSIYDLINEECKAFALLVDDLCPDGNDKAAAIDCIRLARNAYNEAVTPSPAPAKDMTWCWTLGDQQLTMARWLANRAVACGGI